ncbi:MAG: AtzG-like protein [Pseudomonadota bacterium]
MDDTEALAFVKAAAAAVSLPLDDEQIKRVAVHMQRTSLMAAQLDAFTMHVDMEPAEVYSPAPFPTTSVKASPA